MRSNEYLLLIDALKHIVESLQVQFVLLEQTEKSPDSDEKKKLLKKLNKQIAERKAYMANIHKKLLSVKTIKVQPLYD